MPSNRIAYLDWLRLSAVIAVVVYHAVLPFGSFMPWNIQNVERSDALGLLTAMLPFAFPLFFLLAGASARYALQVRSVRSFLTERAARLLVPFVVGTLVLTPPVAYLTALHKATWSGSFLAYLAAYPGLLVDSVKNVGFSPQVFQVVGMHLWFLVWLFLFSFLALPAFSYLSTTRGRAIIEWLARAARWPAGSLLFALPLTLIVLPLFGISAPTGWDWAVFGLWGGTFVGGYLVFSDPRLIAAVRRDLLPALLAAGLGLAGLASTGFTSSIFRGGAHTYDATYAIVVSLHGLTAWAVTISLLSAGMRIGFMQQPLPRLASEAALPIYVLHFPVVIAVSFFVVQWPLGLIAEAIINVVLGVGLSILVAAAALRLPGLRLLLGGRRRLPPPGSARAVPRPSSQATTS